MRHARRAACLSALVLVALGAISTFAPSEAVAQKKVPQGAKVLLLTGGAREHHGYRDQAFYLASALEDTRRFQVTIAEDAAILETPAMKKYDLLIVNADRRDDEFKFTLSQQEALLAYVRDGGGYVSIHGADNAAKDWVDGWRDMLGGVFSHVGLPDSKTKKGKFAITIQDKDHPVTKGIPDFEIQDELYYYLQMRPGVVALATTMYNNEVHPVAWVRTYGKGKVFHTPLGHRDFGPGKHDPIRDPNLLKLVIQGCDWVSGK